MKLKFIAAAFTTGLLTVMGGANATTTPLGPITTGLPTPFSGLVAPGDWIDEFTFSLPANGGSGYSVADFTLLQPTYNTLLTSMTLVSNPDGIMFNGDDSVVQSSLVPGGASLTMIVPATPAGNYYLSVIGVATGTAGGIYTGAISVNPVPVPEPETYALMLAGLGAIGFLARRRQQR